MIDSSTQDILTDLDFCIDQIKETGSLLISAIESYDLPKTEVDCLKSLLTNYSDFDTSMKHRVHNLIYRIKSK